MWIRKSLALVCIVLPAALLTNIGCGVLAFPLEAPKLAAVNTRLIGFTADIADDHGQPLDGVTVTVAPHALTPDFWLVENDEAKNEPPRSADKTFSYSKFGNYAIVVTYSKEGYESRTVAYALEDDIQIRRHDVIMSLPRIDAPLNERINTFKQPRSKVILRKTS